MKTALFALVLAFFAAGCSSQVQVQFDQNQNFSDADMPKALKQESAFCEAVATGQSGAYTHIESLPPRGYRQNFSQKISDIGYTDRLGETKKSRADYIKAVRAFSPQSAKSGNLSEPARYNACMRALSWKPTAEVTGRDRLQIDKNNRANALVEKIKKDPLAEKSIQIMSINMESLSYRQALEEKKRLFADPSIFEQVYKRTRVYVGKNGKNADSRILASHLGMDFARCSAMYNVINQNRETKMQHDIAGNDRLLTMERESFYYATRLLQAETARQEKRAYAKKFKTESGPNLSGLMLRFKSESSQCATMLQGFKRIRFSAR